MERLNILPYIFKGYEMSLYPFFLKGDEYMKLNHLNLCVDDLSEARHFFETFLIFNFRAKGKGIISNE